MGKYNFIDKAKNKVYSRAIKGIASNSKVRDFVYNQLEKRLYSDLVENSSPGWEKAIREKKYHFLDSMLTGVKRNFDKGYISKNVLKKLGDTLVKNSLESRKLNEKASQKFREKYGVLGDVNKINCINYPLSLYNS